MKIIAKYHFLFFWLITGICFLAQFESHYTAKLIEGIHINTSFDNFHFGGQPLSGVGSAFYWWLFMAYKSLFWQAIGFTIIWLLKVRLIEWLTIVHVTSFLLLFFGFSIYVFISEKPKYFSIADPSMDIINWFFIGGIGLMFLNIILSILKKVILNSSSNGGTT